MTIADIDNYYSPDLYANGREFPKEISDEFDEDIARLKSSIDLL